MPTAWYRPPNLTCSCTMVDVTSFGDQGNVYTPVRDPDCPIHFPVEAPEVECCRCHEVKLLKTSTWEEHDPRYRGWWCHDCRVDAGFDVGYIDEVGYLDDLKQYQVRFRLVDRMSPVLRRIGNIVS